MKLSFNSDDDLIEALKSGGEKRHQAMSHIFFHGKLRKRIEYFLQHKNGNLEEVNDILTESFIIFERNIRNNKFKKEASIYTYFLSIAKHYWLNKLRVKTGKIIQQKPEELNISDIQNPELILMEEDLKFQLAKVLDMLSDKCKKVLKYWSNSYSFSEISDELDLGTANNARKQKFYCIRKLAVKLKENPELIPVHYHGGL